MKIFINDVDFSGRPLAQGGIVYRGDKALHIIEQLQANPFEIGMAPREFMRKYLDKVGATGVVLSGDAEDAARTFLQYLVDHNFAHYEPDGKDGRPGDETGKTPSA